MLPYARRAPATEGEVVNAQDAWRGPHRQCMPAHLGEERLTAHDHSQPLQQARSRLAAQHEGHLEQPVT